MTQLFEIIVIFIIFASGILFYLKIRKERTNRRRQPTPPRATDMAKYYSKAAERGDVDAQYNLANMYRAGYGVPQDHARALKWYKIAAEKGHIYARFNLGQIYEKGEDFQKATKWYCKAANQGLKHARRALEDLPRKRCPGRDRASFKCLPYKRKIASCASKRLRIFTRGFLASSKQPSRHF